MSLTNSPIWFGSGATGGGLYGYEINDSLRFNNDDGAYLNRTPSTAGNRKTWTWSGWVKLGNINIDRDFFTAAGSGTQLFECMITSGNTIQVYTNSQVVLNSTQVLRDTSAWYHLMYVNDTTQTTASNRFKIYLNGAEITAFATDNRSSYSQNFDGGINSTVAHYIGQNQVSGNRFDGYMAEVNFIDGQALDPTSFGETKSGVWIPKAYGGSYGTNGFHLDFSNNSTATNLGLDSSGNSNNWSVNGIATTDQMIDTPTNNFATLNPLDNTGQILSEGNLKFYNNASSHKGVRGSFGMASGQWYFECSMSSISGGDQQQFGLARQNVTCPTNGSAGDTFMIYSGGGNPSNIYIYKDGTSLGVTAQSVAVGDVFKCAYDADTGKLWLGKNNDWYNSSGAVDGSANPATGTNPTMTLSETEPLVTWVHSYSNAGTYNICNFGQDGTFAGNITAGGNADSNGVGDFKYSVPSGYLALCTANLPEPVVGPLGDSLSDENFNTVLFSATAGSGGSITGYGFAPDWLWTKARNTTQSHQLFDSVRGDNKILYCNLTNKESEQAAGYFTLENDGFDYGTSTFSSNTYVGWGWLAGTAFSNSAGSNGATIASSGSVNTDAGFSIVSYVGTGSAGTVYHGLSSTPEFITIKDRDYATGRPWGSYHFKLNNGVNPEDERIQLNEVTKETNDIYVFNSTAPTSNVFSLGTSSWNNTSGNDIIAYCFHSVDGYSKVGSYTGNGVADGPFVYTGFRPAWVLIKSRTAGYDWVLDDAFRSPYNEGNATLYPNDNYQEYIGGAYGIDFLSNGFKPRTSYGQYNQSGGGYIYLAFAENPFKYANAR